MQTKNVTQVTRASSSDLVIYFKKPADWQAAYIHYWGTGVNNNINSDWYNSPQMIDGDNGWFSYTFANEDEAGFLFKDVPDNNYNHKTVDLNTNSVDNEAWCYYQNGTIVVSPVNPESGGNLTMHYKKPADWENVYIHYWATVPGNQSSDWNNCPQMSDEGDCWVSFIFEGQVYANFLFKRYAGNVSSADKTVDLNSSEISSEGWYMNNTWYQEKPGNIGQTNQFLDGNEVATVTITNKDSDERTYKHSTNIELRGNVPANKTRTYKEEAGQIIIRTGHDMFDALFALAVQEVRDNSVLQITDCAFNGNQPIDCECFETGRLWHYVWTRDLSYSVHLALASINLVRAKNSLLYKVSNRKNDGESDRLNNTNIQIVQDTGSGGSYPVSTDRVVWAIAAYELLKYLDGNERSQFLDVAYKAIVNTIEQDRKIVYDAADGLYTGEQSFLDWREQSYPSWTENNTLSVGVSKALSTNIAHYKIIDIAAKLAEERGKTADKNKYADWALNLKNAINNKLYIEEEKLYSTQIITDLAEVRVNKYDLLGESFAVIFDVASESRAKDILAEYPHTTKGAAVMHPQHAHHFTYHNRGIWPFVTSYWLKAAKKVKNAKVVDHNIFSLMRVAALNISNMENFEFLTGNNADTNINSQRQLWSVAGYISMVQDVVFGLEVENDKLRFLPFVTKNLRNKTFMETDKIELKNFKYKGKLINVVINLPEKSEATDGYFEISAIKLNSNSVGIAFINNSSLAASNTIEITLTDAATESGTINLITDNSSPLHWAPKEPIVSNIRITNNKIELVIDANGETGVTYNIYRDGILVASQVTASRWSDLNSTDYANNTYSYNVQSVNAAGNVSFPSKSICYWGTGERLQIVNAADFSSVRGGEFVDNHGKEHYQNWGSADHSITISNFKPGKSGEYFIQLDYGNGAGPISTGITCAVKKIEVSDAQTGEMLTTDIVMLPQLGSWPVWTESSIAKVNLSASKTYNVKIYEDFDIINMSYFNHFKIYTGGLGGGDNSFNYVNISAVKFLFIKP